MPVVPRTQRREGPNFDGQLDEAAAMTEGTRITFIPGLQALFAEALKNICFVKGIPVTFGQPKI